jgi:hypothetical protein
MIKSAALLLESALRSGLNQAEYRDAMQAIAMILALPTWRKRYKRSSKELWRACDTQHMQTMMDADMMGGDLGGLVSVILLVLVIAAFVHYVFRR